MSAPLQTYQYSQTWGLLDEHGSAVMDKSVMVYLAADVARVFKPLLVKYRDDHLTEYSLEPCMCELCQEATRLLAKLEGE